MMPGYIYVLQNALYNNYVIKIGFTKLEPNVRARQLYDGSSGVPIPFEVAIAYSVGDYKQAETIIHKRLAAFRLNGRREFFRSSPEVAARIIYETCADINEKLGLAPPEPFDMPASSKKTNEYLISESDEYDLAGTTEVSWDELKKLKLMPLGTSVLSPDQVDRAGIVCMLLAQVYPDKRDEWLNGFSRDVNPESELRIWESITKAYLTIEQVDFASDQLKKEAFALLLLRSLHPARAVLDQFRLRHFSHKSAKKLLKEYKLRPKPLVVTEIHPVL